MTKYVQPNFPGIYTQNTATLREFDKHLITTLTLWENVLHAILDRGLLFDDNVDVRRVSVTSHATPGTEFSIAHTLGKVPTGYIVAGQDAAGSVFDGATANTEAALYLKSDVSSKTFRLIIF